jgi:hypothetical protein
MIPAFILILSAVAYRIAAGLLIHSGTALWLSNFAPLAAIALCGAAYFPPKLKFAVPLGALFISDLVLNYVYGAPLLQAQMLGHYIALFLVGLIGFAIQNRASLKTLLPASILGSTSFYLITNTFSWLSEPGYAKNFAGLIQAQTIGLPVFGGTTPTWMFFRNTLLSDLFFTLLFVACMDFGRNISRARAEAALPRVA